MSALGKGYLFIFDSQFIQHNHYVMLRLNGFDDLLLFVCSPYIKELGG